MTGYSTLGYDVDDGLLRLTLNRPDQLNVFTKGMAHELVDAYTRASADDAVRAIVVTGAGPAFYGGMDLSVGGNVFGLDESQRPGIADVTARPVAPEIEAGGLDLGGQVSLAMFACLKPILGAINGAAVGIGATMILPMDFRLISTKGRVGFVFGRIGITPEACSTWSLPRIAGLTQALEWFYRAEVIEPAELLEKVLVRPIHEPETLVEDACAFARSLVRDRSPVSAALIRQMTLRNGGATHPREAHDVDSLSMFYTSLGDGKEGVASFLEKRTPHFTGRASAMPPFWPWQED